jgi:hypothetical protein
MSHPISDARPILEAAYTFVFIKFELSILISMALSESALWSRGPKSTDSVYVIRKPIAPPFPLGKQL